MSNYDDTNTFVLFTNDKGDNPKRPDRTGKINIDGTWYKLSGWLKDGKSGKFLSGKVQPIEDEKKPQKAKAQVYAGNDEPNDSMPF